MKLPTYVQIEPVGQCNLRCQMCAIPFRKDGPPYGPLAFMKWETFTRLLDQFPELEHLHLQGLGEPMMHPRFFEMVRFASARGVRVTTNSNFSLLTARRAEECVTCGLAELHVSMDGATPETYERIRVRGHYDKLLRNFDLLRDAKRQFASDLPALQLVMVIMRQNLHELPDLVRFASRYRISGMFVQHLAHDFAESSLPSDYKPMREFVGAQTLMAEDPERIERYFGEARRVAGELGINLRLPSIRMKMHAPGTPGAERCTWPRTGAYISYQGLAMPCCMVSTPDRINFGSMADLGVETVWNGEAFQSFRDRLNSEKPPEICASCSIYKGTF